MIIYKAYKFRVYPTKEQEVLLAKHFGSCRFIYNHFLNIKKEKYINEKTSLNYIDTSKILTELKKQEEYIWLNEIGSQYLQSALRNLDSAHKRFFDEISKFPRFKSKNDKQSFIVPQRIFIRSNKLSIPKFMDGIKINIHREIEGKIKHAIISKTKTGKYYVSLHCEVERIPSSKTDLAIGIDTGIKDLAILSDGTKYPNPKFLKKSKKKLQYQQRQLSKKQKRSKSRNKQRLVLARQYEKITNSRNDHLHKISTEIIKNHDIICVEDLKVKNLIKNHSLAESFGDVALGTFYSMLQYKAEWNNRQFIKIDRFYPSSKTCNICGYINQNLTLSVREWKCPDCGQNHDRDINAAKNILKQGLNILSGSGVESDIKQKQMEALSLDESMKSGILNG
jgi:putative transposase